VIEEGERAEEGTNEADEDENFEELFHGHSARLNL